MGNYYVVKPFFEELHRVFPTAEIVTTFQMSERFCQEENITCLPMELYYAWTPEDLPKARFEYELAKRYHDSGILNKKTPFMDVVTKSDLVIDFSGDIWGQNADAVGPNRFEIGLLKDRTAQLLGKPTAMLAGSPGPFRRDSLLDFAKEVFGNFDLVTNREPVSRRILDDYGFDLTRCYDCACPAFEFEPTSQERIAPLISNSPLQKKDGRLVIGFILCGWNMQKGPFSRTDWTDSEFDVFRESIQRIIQKYNAKFCFLSHSNGFVREPDFSLVHGRDYPIVKRLFDILNNNGVSGSLYLFEGIYSVAETKKIISNFDILVSGRVHGAVAGLSQNVPTVMIDYGHEPKAHKIRGFAEVANVKEYIADPSSYTDVVEKISSCIDHRDEIRQMLAARNKHIRSLVRKNFDLLAEIVVKGASK